MTALLTPPVCPTVSCRAGDKRGVRWAATFRVACQVDEQSALVRKLKEVDGLTNGDAAVKEAVAELLRLKALLEAASAPAE